jgi:hypothetical protein
MPNSQSKTEGAAAVRVQPLVRAMLRIWWRCLPHSRKPAKLQDWHTCHGDAAVDYYWRWHWVMVNRGFGDAQNWNYYKETYGHAWYE